MTKDRLVRQMKEQAELPSMAAAEQVYEAIVESVAETLAGGEEVGIRGFGTFSVVSRAERTGRNPRTGETMTIPGGRKVKFAPGSELKSATAVLAGGSGAEWLKGKEYFRGMERQLEDLKEKLEDYRAKSETLGNDAKALYKENAKRLSEVMEEVRYKFTLLKSGSGGAIEELKKGADGAFAELKAAFQRAWGKF
jgi:nucleoid DNA-binding protein